MRIFLRKQKPSQQIKSTSSTTHGRAFSVQNHAVKSILQLQRTVGNQATLRMLRGKEPDSDPLLSNTSVSDFGHDFSRIPVNKKDTLPTSKLKPFSPNSTDGIRKIAAEGIRGPGIRMPHFEHIERYFRHYDLSNVRAHVGGIVRESCDEIGASAFTMGNHMAFREAPDIGTVAHEVTHVIQQSHGLHPQGGIGQAGDQLERMADRVSTAVEQKCSVDSLLSIGSGNELKRAKSYPSVQFLETPESSRSPFTEGLPEAEHTFEGDRYVRPLNDGSFHNIFYNRNKVIVVQFWNAHCRGPCGRMAHHISAVAESYRTGPYADFVRFYHVQLGSERDTARIPNPRLSSRFTFGTEGTLIPVTYFYYTATGRVPTNEAPLLEASIAGAVPSSDIIWRINYILHRHGHQREHRPVPTTRREPSRSPEINPYSPEQDTGLLEDIRTAVEATESGLPQITVELLREDYNYDFSRSREEFASECNRCRGNIDTTDDGCTRVCSLLRQAGVRVERQSTDLSAVRLVSRLAVSFMVIVPRDQVPRNGEINQVINHEMHRLGVDYLFVQTFKSNLEAAIRRRLLEVHQQGGEISDAVISRIAQEEEQPLFESMQREMDIRQAAIPRQERRQGPLPNYRSQIPFTWWVNFQPPVIRRGARGSFVRQAEL